MGNMYNLKSNEESDDETLVDSDSDSEEDQVVEDTPQSNIW